MRRIILAAALLFSLPALAGPQVKGKFDLFLNGVNKGYEKFKIETKKGELQLSSEVRFQIPMEKAKRKYVELYLYPVLSTDPATGKFLQYSYRVTFNDFSKTDMVEAQDSATEFLDHYYGTSVAAKPRTTGGPVIHEKNGTHGTSNDLEGVPSATGDPSRGAGSLENGA